MVAVYTDVDKVGNALGFPDSYFDGSSTPTSTVITNFIERAQDRVDKTTGHAWRTITVTEEYVRPSSIYRYGTGVRLDLRHRSLTSFQSGTDKIEVWDGSSWVDWVATKTEGRNEDWWVDEQNGVVFLLGLYRVYPHGIRITYRYGESTVPGGIEEATTLMAAKFILNSPEFSTVLFTDATNNDLNHRDTIEHWQKEIDSILEKYSEFTF